MEMNIKPSSWAVIIVATMSFQVATAEQLASNSSTAQTRVPLGYGPYSDGVHLGYGNDSPYYGKGYDYQPHDGYALVYRDRGIRDADTNRHHGALHDRHAPDHHAYDGRYERHLRDGVAQTQVRTRSHAYKQGYYGTGARRQRPYGNHRQHHDGISGSHGYQPRSSSARRSYSARSRR